MEILPFYLRESSKSLLCSIALDFFRRAMGVEAETQLAPKLEWDCSLHIANFLLRIAPQQPGRMSLPFSSTLCFASFGCPFFNLEFEVIHRMRLLLWKTDFPSCLKIEKAGISQSVLLQKIRLIFLKN